jgi:2-isopropylmalate synthase
VIEAGFPSSNPKELELFELLAEETFDNAEIAAFGMTRRSGVKAQDDETMKVLAECFAPVVTIVGKTWALHLEKVTKVSREENLAMIGESVAFLVAAGKRVMYDSEHFFDAWRDDSEYALQCVHAAATGGAERVVLCDTNGSSMPGDVAEATAAVVAALKIGVGVHCHDDLGLGVANTLAGVGAGATQVQGTMNGIGERTGNANLTTIIGTLQAGMGIKVLSDDQLQKLTETAHFVDELLNVSPNSRAPWVGRNAFAHKGGMHTAGMRADAATYEHADPEVVGNRRKLVISELAGRHTVHERAAAAGIDVNDEQVQNVLARVKQLEHEGYQFEAADGSFELLLREETGVVSELFKLESWRVIIEQRADGKVQTEATIKIWIDGEQHIRTAEGAGPVNALDTALRAAIVETHPHLADVELVDYKVRILDTTSGTDATVRVIIESTDGEDTWGTTGVNENIIAASWGALVDSLAYAEQPRHVGARGSSEMPGR